MPGATKTSICNMALAHCGVNARILDVDNEKSNEAIQCRLFYDHVRVLLLETLAWPFATVRIPLQSLGTPPTGWRFRYKYPVDCVLAVKIVDENERSQWTSFTHYPNRAFPKIPFKVALTQDTYGRAILCDKQDAVLEYNADVTDPNLFPTAFVQAIALGIASHISMPLRVSADITAYLGKQFQGWLAEAVNLAQREQQDDTQKDSEFESVRS